MFDNGSGSEAGGEVGEVREIPVGAVTITAAVRELAQTLRTAGRAGPAEPAGAAGAHLIDLVTGLAGLVSAAEACSARAVVALDRVRRQEEAARGVPAARRGSGVAAEVGLARKESARRGQVMLGLAKVLCTEMPHTWERLAAGDLTPWRAMLLARESACLDRQERVRLDAELCADPALLAGRGDRAVEAAARAWCCREDPASVVERRSRVEAERRVSLRPAPDTMAYLTALLPVADGVAAYRSLTERADRARAAGDARSRGQVMADALVAGVTGRAEGAAPGVLVNLVMTDSALFSGDGEPAVLPGFGPVPAAAAREMVVRSGRDAGAFVRRLYRAPGSGALVAMDARTRQVPAGLAALVEIRDGGTCRMPWCDAPVRHTDHVVGHADGGATAEPNLQGLCEAHNYAKQASGWRAVPVARGARFSRAGPGGGRHLVLTSTPSGHTYTSTAPPLPGTALRPPDRSVGSPGERVIADLVARQVA